MHLNCAHEPTIVFTTGETSSSQKCRVRSTKISGLPRFPLRFQKFIALFEDGIDGLRGTGIQTKPAAFQTARWIEFVGRR